MFAVQYLLRETLQAGFTNLATDAAAAARALDGLPPALLGEGVRFLALKGAAVGGNILMAFPDRPVSDPSVAVLMDSAEEVDQAIGQGAMADPANAGSTVYATTFAGSFSCLGLARETDAAIWLGMATTWLLLAARPALSDPAYGGQLFEQSLALSGVAPVAWQVGGSDGVFGTTVSLRCRAWAQYDLTDTAVTRLALAGTYSFTNPYESIEADVETTAAFTP